MEKETGRVYTCPKCKADLGIKSLKTGVQPLYRINPDAHAAPSDLSLWHIAQQIDSPFSSSDLNKEYLLARAMEIMEAKQAAADADTKTSDVDTSFFGYSTIRARVQKWKKEGFILLCEEKRKPKPITCLTCGEKSEPHGIVGAFTSDRKNSAATQTLAKFARPLHKATRSEKVWEVINEFKGNFTPQQITALCPGTSLSTVRQRIYRWVKDGRLKTLERGLYKRTAKWTKTPHV